MFQYPNYFAYQMPTLARANLQAMLNISSRVAGSWQALAELNVQTMKKMVEESNALLRAGEESSAGDVLGWQSVMFAQFPQKAASYGQHLLSIITSTEADVIGEVRSQYERNGIKFKDMMDTAANDAQEAAQSSSALVTDLTNTANEAAQETSAVVLDSTGEVAKTARSNVKRSV
jgi:hypothetical protein